MWYALTCPWYGNISWFPFAQFYYVLFWGNAIQCSNQLDVYYLEHHACEHMASCNLMSNFKQWKLSTKMQRVIKWIEWAIQREWTLLFAIRHEWSEIAPTESSSVAMITSGSPPNLTYTSPGIIWPSYDGNSNSGHLSFSSMTVTITVAPADLKYNYIFIFQDQKYFSFFPYIQVVFLTFWAQFSFQQHF